MNELDTHAAILSPEAIAIIRQIVRAEYNALQSQQSIDDGSNIINGRQAKHLLGGISDRTLSSYRKRYPEMIAGGPTSRSYYRDVVVRIARNHKKFSPNGVY